MRHLLYLSLVLGALLLVVAYHPGLLTGPEQAGYQAMPDSMLSHLVTTTSVVGAVVVFLFYWFRFSRWTGPDEAPTGFRPHPTSHSTTWLRYVIWASLYAGIMVATYSFVILFPQVLPNLSPFIDTLGIDIPGLAKLGVLAQEGKLGADHVVPYALILTLVALTSLAERPEHNFRKRMQSLALIPTEGKSLVDRMAAKIPSFEADPNVVAGLGVVTSNLLTFDDFRSGDSLAERLARCMYINHQLNALHREEVKAVADRHKEELGAISTSIGSLVGDVEKLRDEQFDFLSKLKPRSTQAELLRAFRSERLDTQPASAIGLSELTRQRDVFGDSEPYAMRYFEAREQQIGAAVDGMLNRLYQLAVCSVLGVAYYPGKRNSLFRKLGFDMKDPFGPRLRRDTIWRAMIVLVCTIFATSGAYYLVFGMGVNLESVPIEIRDLLPESLWVVAVWTAWGCAMQLLGVTGGYWMERSFEVARSDTSEKVRTGVVAQSHMANYVEAYLLAVTLNVFLFASIASLSGNWAERLSSMWLWALVPGVSGAFTSYYMRRAPDHRWHTCQFALLQGAMTAAAAFVVLLFKYDSLRRGEPQVDLSVFMDFSIYSLLSSFLVGGALAVVLQEWVTRENRVILDRSGRDDQRRSPRQQTEEAGDWTAAGKSSVNVRLYDVSKHGTRLQVRSKGRLYARLLHSICPWLFDNPTRLTDAEGGEGQLTLSDGRTIHARVVRHVNQAFSCLEFTEKATAEPAAV